MGDQLFARADLAQAAVDPLLGQLLLHAILRKPRAEAREIDQIHLLVLIEAGKQHILVLLQALQIFFVTNPDCLSNSIARMASLKGSF
jgi:hypothetical protein